MKRALVALVMGTVVTGIAAAYAATMQRVETVAVVAADADAPEFVSPFEKVDAERLAAN